MLLQILIVDDEVKTAERIGESLTQRGFKVDVAADGREGLEKFRHQEYDAIILDIRLLDIIGTELFAEIRAVSYFIPVIMLTSYASKESAVESAHLQVFDYVEKPIKDWEGFLDTVERAIRTKDPAVLAIEEWVKRLPPQERQRPLIFEGLAAYSPEELLKEVRKNTEFGRRQRLNIERLIADLSLEGIDEGIRREASV